MSAPKRWLDEDGGAAPLERELLQAGRAMDPPDDAMEGVWAALSAQIGPFGGGGSGGGGSGGGGGFPEGMGAPPTAAPPAAPPPAAAPSATVSAAATKVASGAAWAGFGKGIVIALVSAAAVAGGYAALRSSAPEIAAPQAAITTEVAPAPQAEVAPTPQVEVAPAPQAKAGSSVATHVPPRPPAKAVTKAFPPPNTPPAAEAGRDENAATASVSASHTSRLIEENRMLGEARAALRGGDASSSLEKLDEMGSVFSGGVLAQEREALAIEALYRAGKRDIAAARAEAFLRAYPKSPHATKVRGFAKWPPSP